MLPTASSTSTSGSCQLPASPYCGNDAVPWYIPSLALPETRKAQKPCLWTPEGLTKLPHTRATPDRSSVACAVTVTVCAPVFVSIAVGLKLKPCNTGGVVSCVEVTVSVVGEPRALRSDVK